MSKNNTIYQNNWQRIIDTKLKNCRNAILSDGQLSQNVIDMFSEVRKRQRFINGNSFNKNTQIHHTVHDELKIETSVPIIDNALQYAIKGINNEKRLYVACNEEINAFALKEDFLNCTNNVYCVTGKMPGFEKW